MRVLHVIHDFIPERSGGSEVSTRDLCLNLRTLGMECTVFCRGFASDVGKYDVYTDEVDGIPVTRVQQGVTGRHEFWVRRDERLDEAFRQELRRTRPDVVHFQHFTGLSDGMAAIARAERIPSVYTLHDYWVLCPLTNLLTVEGRVCERQCGRQCIPCLWPNPGSRLLAPAFSPAVLAMRGALPVLPRWVRAAVGGERAVNATSTWLAQSRELFDLVDVVTSPSAFLRDVISARGPKHPDFRIVRNGVEKSRFARRTLPASGRPRFGFIGSNWFKGLSVLLDAFETLPQKSSELHIFARLSGTLEERVRRLMPRGDVFSHGAFESGEVGSIFGEFDVLVAPSVLYENSPIVILEAFASGAPVVASNAGGMAEAVRDGIDGLLFELGNSADLAEKLAAFVDDEGLAARLASGIGEVVSQADTAAAFLALYTELLERSRGSLTGCRQSA